MSTIEDLSKVAQLAGVAFEAVSPAVGDAIQILAALAPEELQIVETWIHASRQSEKTLVETAREQGEIAANVYQQAVNARKK